MNEIDMLSTQLQETGQATIAVVGLFDGEPHGASFKRARRNLQQAADNIGVKVEITTSWGMFSASVVKA